MKKFTLIDVYAFILLIVFGGIVVHAPLSVFIGTIFPDASLAVKSWKEILMLVASLMAVYLLWRDKAFKKIIGDRIIQVAFLYAALHTLMAAAFLMGVKATLAGLAIDLRYVLFFVLVYTCIKLNLAYRRKFVKVGLAGAAIVIGFGVLQLFLPADILTHIGYNESTIQPYLTVDKNPDFIRINSTLRGPNPLGAYVAIVLGLITAAAVRRRVDISQTKQTAGLAAALLGSLMVLWISYSRSALLAAGLTIFLTIIIASRHLISRRVWVIGGVVLLALAGGLVLGREHSLVENVVLHENDQGGSAVNSNEDHLSSLTDGTSRMLRQPIGAGVGSTGSASLFSDSPLVIENQYLFTAHEVGWFGLMLFLALFLMIMYRLWQLRRDWLSLGVFTSGVGLAFIGLLLPVWVDDTVSIIWWGFAAVAIASGGQHGKRKTKQKAKRSS